jgi:hypothetical protein
VEFFRVLHEYILEVYASEHLLSRVIDALIAELEAGEE